MKKIAIILALVLLVSVTLVGCKKDEVSSNSNGGDAASTQKDVLSGTWESEESYGAVYTWSFDGSGNCSLLLSSEGEALTDQEGTYVLDEAKGTIEVMLELWSDATEFEYTLSGTTLELTSTYADYSLTKK